MKLFTILSYALTLTSALPLTSPTPGDIAVPDDRLVEGRPVGLRPLDGRPVIGRPVEPRPIGLRGIDVEEKRQTRVLPNAYIVEFKQEYVCSSSRYLNVRS
ncbi:hypothetical protein P154DRAFT_524643 [Amniculicola lignicola CBS 123094]|uniref:Uncharacterized protein n=1 Tax=Amniculicola lignicola CBS 123094 TaxID=1392246 RepID=A0A6A5WBT6_9PLEO|nr:hypothetical protein P154DRAFT_524643 [Amniculicola lignicola CBS 123094]